MRRVIGLAIALAMAGGCGNSGKPAAPEGEPRVEVRRAVRRMETIRTDTLDLHGTETKVQQAKVVDVFIYDPGADEVNGELVAKAMPKVVAEMNAGGKTEEPFLVRLYVISDEGSERGWLVSLPPRQLRAMMLLDEPGRARTLQRLPWGVTERRKM